MAFDPQKITFFAKTDARGQGVPFGIRAIDRQRHMYVIGKTGMGKSTMLENMAVQDIQSGEGMAFIDPHGATAEKLLDYVPEHRINDVVYFAPFDMEYPLSFNVMEDVGPDKRHLVVAGLMSTFKKLWVDAWSARMEYILTNTLLALLEYPDSTLLSVNRMLADKEYRKKVVDNVQDMSVKSFWVDEFAKYTDRFAAEATPAIQNKIGQFTGNPLIRNIIGQPKSSFDIRKLMDEKKILIMNLSKGLVGETNTNLLGSMLTTRIYLAAMSRADLPARELDASPNFYFYVDEFQSFANQTFASILSEARKYKLNLTIAHQYIEQMEEEVRDAVFGNVGTTIAFRVGPLDAEFLEAVFTPKFLAADLVNLGFAQIYLTLMIDGVGSQPFSAMTLPPIETPKVSYKDMVIAASRKQFGHERAGVEEMIKQVLAPAVEPERPRPAPRNEHSGPTQGGSDRGPRPQNGGGNDRGPRQQNNGTNGSPRENDRPVGNSGDRNGNDRSRQNRNDDRRDQKRFVPKEKKAADLRNILRSIASAEGGVSDKDENKHTAPEQKDKRPDTRPDRKNHDRPRGGAVAAKEDLRSVLSGIAGGGVAKEAAEQAPKSPEPPRAASASAPVLNPQTPALERQPQPIPPSQEPALQPSRPPVAARTRQPHFTKGPAVTDTARDAKLTEVSSKELERMMRITTSDKPPLV